MLQPGTPPTVGPIHERRSQEYAEQRSPVNEYDHTQEDYAHEPVGGGSWERGWRDGATHTSCFCECWYDVGAVARQRACEGTGHATNLRWRIIDVWMVPVAGRQRSMRWLGRHKWFDTATQPLHKAVRWMLLCRPQTLPRSRPASRPRRLRWLCSALLPSVRTAGTGPAPRNAFTD